ncbi:MAG: TIGR03619 family F420-dependent LLM class oxidoreductase [Anaerolineales bacterium]|nr:TIGR03619 family F420-dependent LLM class oxidoreductase [Anaerolineales bacterium]
MRYGIEIVPFGEFADPRAVVRLARAAEAAGWEAVWVWDHLSFPYGVADPWVMLAAVAASTSTIRLLPGVAALPRYKPALLARLLASLDVLSSGRLILGAGLGALHDEFAAMGEPSDYATRAAMLDEGLAVLARLWTGEPVTHRGAHYALEDLAIRPRPVQQPRMPVWIGGESRAALRRAAAWDGWIMGTTDENSQVTYPPQKVAAQVAVIEAERGETAAFDVAIDGVSQAGDERLMREYADAGATWWFELLFPLRGDEAAMLARVQAGPPRG